MIDMTILRLKTRPKQRMTSDSKTLKQSISIYIDLLFAR